MHHFLALHIRKCFFSSLSLQTLKSMLTWRLRQSRQRTRPWDLPSSPSLMPSNKSPSFQTHLRSKWAMHKVSPAQ